MVNNVFLCLVIFKVKDMEESRKFDGNNNIIG